MAARTPENMGESLKGLRIADYFSSLLHVSGADISLLDNNIVYDGVGTTTGISLSSKGIRVTINNYIEPIGWEAAEGPGDPINGTMEWLDAFFPINSIMLTTTNDNPGNRIANTKWVLQSTGKFLVGAGTGQEVDGVDLKEYEFTSGSRGTGSGDLAGEYCVTLGDKNLPPHTHDVDMKTDIQIRDATDPSTVFCFYFGPTINPQQLTKEKRFAANSGLDIPDIEDNPYSDFLYQDKIEAFQHNTSYTEEDGTVIPQYRNHVITTLFEEGVRYNDNDFDPKLANYTLKGWGGAQVGGPGWGGALVLSENTQVFIENSPRPVGVPWDDGTTILRETSYDPRDVGRVHPGRFGSENLILARNLIIDVLGIDGAREMLADVNRLKELGETVDDYGSDNRFVLEEIEGVATIPTTNTGTTSCHNNIPPSYGVYFWRRVPLDFTEEPVTIRPEDEPEVEIPVDDIVEEVVVEEAVWRYEITQHKKELNLASWARGRGWNGISPVEITLRNNKYLWSDDTTKAGLTIDEFPGGLTFINKGFIIGRGGDGGSWVTAKKKSLWPDRDNGQQENGGYMTGWDGGPAIKITSRSSITINNRNGVIAGGGGGGAGGGTGNFGGGGGGAGGGKGGAGSQGVSRWGDSRERGGAGGSIGQKGGNGENWRRCSSGILKSKVYPDGVFLQGLGGEAGGGGSGGWQRDGNDPHGGGGGGGRKVRKNGNSTSGGGGGAPNRDAFCGGNGGSNNNKGQSVASDTRWPWGNGSGGGGWGADGGDQLTNARNSCQRYGPRKPKGGKGGKAVDSVGGSRYSISGGIVYGKKE